MFSQLDDLQVELRKNRVSAPEALREDDREHIGIENVRSRLSAFCGGALSIHSQSGEGTTAEIILPEERP